MKFGSLFFALGLGLIAHAAGKGDARVESKEPRQIFMDLLKAYRAYPEFFNLVSKGAQTYDSVDSQVVANLPEKVLQSRLTNYNSKYLYYRRLEHLVCEIQFEKMSKRLTSTAISDVKYPDLELKTKLVEKKCRDLKNFIFLWSIDANDSVLDALQTLPPEKRVAVVPAAKTRPKMPGVFEGSRADRIADRSKMGNVDNITLTPLDDEFYQSQIGQKLEKDLGGRADFWSYDFDADELYVVAGGGLSKVRVKQESPGVRYIQTRVGSKFDEPTGSDMKVDMLKAQGRFLTGDKGAETLFGKVPPAEQKYAPPGKAGAQPPHAADDGHDHK